MRTKEMKTLTLYKDKRGIDFRHLHLTVYGFQVLQALEIGMIHKVKTFKEISKALQELGFTLEVGKQLYEEEFSPPPNMSDSLAEYILQLVKSRTTK